MAFTPPAAFEHLGAFVFSDHALHLEEQFVFGRLTEFAVEKHQIDTGALKLIDQHHLIGILTRQPIRRVHIDPFDLAVSDRIAQPFQCRAYERRAAVTGVDKLVIRAEYRAVVCDALTQRRELAVDDLGLGLLFGGDPGI